LVWRSSLDHNQSVQKWSGQSHWDTTTGQHRRGAPVTTDSPRQHTRNQVLTQIRTAQIPPSVDELATSLGLHRNSVRLHARALQQAGLVTQSTRANGSRGRPLTVYQPTRTGARAGSRNYALLA